MYKLPKATHRARPTDQDRHGGHFLSNKIKASSFETESHFSFCVPLPHLDTPFYFPQIPTSSFSTLQGQSLHGLPRHHNPLRSEISVLQNHPSFPNPSSQPVQANFSQDQTQQSYRTIVGGNMWLKTPAGISDRGFLPQAPWGRLPDNLIGEEEKAKKSGPTCHHL